MALFAYFSSFIWESQKKWSLIRSDQTNIFDQHVRKIIGNSRNSLKLFEDRVVGRTRAEA